MIDDDLFDLQRFIEAQAIVYENVIFELNFGKKKTHWMWYIFPQIEGLGNSDMATKYSIKSLDEAVAYVNNPILGQRLKECTKKVLFIEGKSIDDIFDYPDNLKFKSCMTLFALVSQPNSIFSDALKKYFFGEQDNETLSLVGIV